MTDRELRREIAQAFDQIRTELRALREMFKNYPELEHETGSSELVGTKGES